MRYTVILEHGDTSWGARVPDLPGCVAAGETREEALQLIREATDCTKYNFLMSPTPAAKERELQLAELVEQLMIRDFGFDPGRRSERDARDPSGLKVDFTYDEVCPPLAVEVTSPRDPQFTEAMAKVTASQGKLTKLAELEGWGSYAVGVYEHVNANKLEGAVAQIIRDMIAHGRDRIDVDFDYGDEYSRARAVGVHQDFLRRNEVLRAAGLQLVHKVNEEENRVRLVMVRGGVETGFSRTLNRAINNNRVKLAEARGAEDRQTHLIVDISELAAPSPVTSDTPTPSLNRDVDMLWVVNDADRSPYPVWSARRGDSSWTSHAALLEFNRSEGGTS